MIRITCTQCQKPLSIDETKLPMREVAFPCPVCKAKLTIDRRSFEEQPAAATQTPSPDHPHEAEDHENDLGAKALIVGVDDPALRHAAKLIGLLPVFHADPVKAREYYMQEYPPLVLVNPAQLTTPPLESMSPIISLVPADRRKSFFMLVGEGLRSLDGNAAFLYGVNAVVSARDVAQLPQIHRQAHTEHERLYASFDAVAREKQGAG